MGDCCVGVSTVPSVLGRDRCINCFELLKHTKLDRVAEVEAVVLSLNINYSAKRSRKIRKCLECAPNSSVKLDKKTKRHWIERTGDKTINTGAQLLYTSNTGQLTTDRKTH